VAGMTSIFGIPAALLVLGLVGWASRRVMRTWRRFRGARVVACPETGEAAAVELAVWHIRPGSHVRNCSRWRVRAPCGQACLRLIEAAPEEFLVRAILARWYQDKQCICCGNPVGAIGRWRHNPCLMSPDLRILQWKEIRPEYIPGALTTHAPICWTCLVAQTHLSLDQLHESGGTNSTQENHRGTTQGTTCLLCRR